MKLWRNADARVAGVGPEERRADRLGEAETDGAADQRAEQIGDLGFAEAGLDEDDGRAEQGADAGIDGHRRTEWPQQRRRPGDGGHETRSNDDMPGHEDSGYENAARMNEAAAPVMILRTPLACLSQPR